MPYPDRPGVRGKKNEVLDREWQRGALDGHDHDAPASSLCEDE
jgi:hypothetical protein